MSPVGRSPGKILILPFAASHLIPVGHLLPRQVHQWPLLFAMSADAPLLVFYPRHSTQRSPFGSHSIRVFRRGFPVGILGGAPCNSRCTFLFRRWTFSAGHWLTPPAGIVYLGSHPHLGFFFVLYCCRSICLSFPTPDPLRLSRRSSLLVSV